MRSTSAEDVSIQAVEPESIAPGVWANAGAAPRTTGAAIASATAADARGRSPRREHAGRPRGFEGSAMCPPGVPASDRTASHTEWRRPARGSGPRTRESDSTPSLARDYPGIGGSPSMANRPSRRDKNPGPTRDSRGLAAPSTLMLAPGFGLVLRASRPDGCGVLRRHGDARRSLLSD